MSESIVDIKIAIYDIKITFLEIKIKFLRPNPNVRILISAKKYSRRLRLPSMAPLCKLNDGGLRK